MGLSGQLTLACLVTRLEQGASQEGLYAETSLDVAVSDNPRIVVAVVHRQYRWSSNRQSQDSGHADPR